MRLSSLACALALTSLSVVPAVAQTTPPNTSPGTSVNEQTLPPAQKTDPAANDASKAAPPANSGTRALTPGQNPDSTPSRQSPGQAPQLPGMKGQGN